MYQAVRKFEGLLIYAAAFEALGSGGFTAGVVITTARTASGERTEVFRDELLLGGESGWIRPRPSTSQSRRAKLQFRLS